MPYENTCYHRRLFDTFRKTGHVFVNQVFSSSFSKKELELWITNWSQMRILLFLAGYETCEWQAVPNFILFFFLFPFPFSFFPFPFSLSSSVQKKKQIWFHRALMLNLCRSDQCHIGTLCLHDMDSLLFDLAIRLSLSHLRQKVLSVTFWDWEHWVPLRSW